MTTWAAVGLASGLRRTTVFQGIGRHEAKQLIWRDNLCLVLSHPALALKQNRLPLDFSRPSVAPNMQGKCSLRGYLS